MNKPSDRQESFVVNQITEKFENLRRLREEVQNNFLHWIPIRRRTRTVLDELASKLHEHHKNVNISTVTGASMGTVGGVLCIAGLIATPFTFGAGAIVSLVGAGIGGTGGLVLSGSKVVEMVLTKLGLKEIQEAIDDDREACRELQEQLLSLECFISELATFLRPLHDDAELLRELEGSGFEFLRDILDNDFGPSTEERVEFGARFFRTLTSAATVSASAVATAGALARSAALAGTRVAHVAGSIISVALLPLDITLLVKSSLELHRGTTSSTVEEIRRILIQLECPENNEIQGMIESFIDEKFTEAYNKMDEDVKGSCDADEEESDDSFIDVDQEASLVENDKNEGDVVGQFTVDGEGPFTGNVRWVRNQPPFEN